MAVTINAAAFLDSIPAVLVQDARRVIDDGRVGELEHNSGGVQALVTHGAQAFQPWVGVVGRALHGECDCSHQQGELCAHAIAVALTAFDLGVRWAATATPPSAAPVDDEQARYLTAVRRLAPRQLSALVVAQAANDRMFAATLLRTAQLLDAPDAETISRFREVLRDTLNVCNEPGWELSDLAAAGHRLLSEAEILAQHPATTELLDSIEEAIVVWDNLSCHLHAAQDVLMTDPAEISEPLAEIHLQLCGQLGLDQVELGRRLIELLQKCEFGDSVDLDAYGDLLGGKGMAVVEQFR